MKTERENRELACQWMERVGIDRKIIKDYRDLEDHYWEYDDGGSSDAIYSTAFQAVLATANTLGGYLLGAPDRESAVLAAQEAASGTSGPGSIPEVEWRNYDIIWHCAYPYHLKSNDGLQEVFEWLDKQEKA